MTDDMKKMVLAAIQRAPEWLRQDLNSKDAASRERAEETLAAMIGDVITASELK